MSTRIVHVAVGVIRDASGAVLLQQRAANSHQGGLWEFPGGKLDAGEGVVEALARELYEELAITVQSADPLIRVHHSYPDRRVLLDVWDVSGYGGRPVACEGQPLQWVEPAHLPSFQMPAADRPIVNALRLPRRMAITPEPEPDRARFVASACTAGRRTGLLQLRAHTVPRQELVQLARQLADAAGASNGFKLVINADPSHLAPVAGAGLHLSAARLRQQSQRPPWEGWVGASCHSPEELALAASLPLDYALLSPVLPTASHPEAAALGWSRFARMIDSVPIPVYALGGMQADHYVDAVQSGAQGIAAMRQFWPNR